MYSHGVESVLHIIQSVYHVGNQHLILEFDAGEYRVVNMTPFLKGPVFDPLKEPAFFRQVKVVDGTVSWPNGADLDPDVLYASSTPLVLPGKAQT